MFLPIIPWKRYNEGGISIGKSLLELRGKDYIGTSKMVGTGVIGSLQKEKKVEKNWKKKIREAGGKDTWRVINAESWKLSLTFKLPPLIFVLSVAGKGKD